MAKKKAAKKKISVRLRYVGVYFDEMISVDAGSNIEKVMDEAMMQFPRINYISEFATPTKKTLKTVTHDFPGSKRRPSGVYTLTDTGVIRKGDPKPNPFTVWQYYVVDDEGVVQSTDGKFIPYPKNPIKLGDDFQIIWRLLVILGEPNPPSPSMPTIVV